ncbi:hypothetical protein niasHT_008030 [Heterodera trifolii]|uniref:Uncharacterized protein n=1 Tax=Heterodera trifolii TaxID=157864 RepID=A0ABD2LZR3_9BILA
MQIANAPIKMCFPRPIQLNALLIARVFLFSFSKISTVTTQYQQTVQAYPTLLLVPLPMYGPSFVGYDTRDECVDRRPDCAIFRHVCDHPDYQNYMYGCCSETCDPKCGRRGESPSGETNKARDEARERRNEEAIRRKYLGDSDYFRPKRDWQQNEWAVTERPPFGREKRRREIAEGAKWRDDDRWDRNDPWTLRRG